MPNQVLRNLFIVFIVHTIFREFLYWKFKNKKKNLSLPRQAYFLSIISWVFAGFAAFSLHLYLYPDFPVLSHVRIFLSYLILGAAILAQLEYILFEIRYNTEGIISQEVTIDMLYIGGLMIFIAIVLAVSFGNINSVKSGKYNNTQTIHRPDELGEIAETRSKETENHVKRVAEHSYLLVIKAGLSEEEASILKLASPMHDIGKVGIPDNILNKPGKLTFEEFEVMKTHAQLVLKC